MGKYCLIPKLAGEFKKRLASGDVDPEKLATMTSEERHNVFTKFLDEENATNVNALFESKMLQKYKWNAILNWAKEVTGIKPEVRTDLVARIEKMSADPNSILNAKTEKEFLKDLVNTRLGMGISHEETQQIVELSNNVVKLREKMNPKTFEFSSKDTAYKYGIADELLTRYVADLKNRARAMAYRDYLKKPWQAVFDLSGVMKSMVATLDNSFHLRQGLWALTNHPVEWTKTFLNSWKWIGKELKGEDAMLLIKGDIRSRKNALNGLYRKARLDVELNSEEAFPSSFPEKIPVFRRLYKASETAYNGSALRLRADIFDKLVAKAEKNGLDVFQKEVAEDLGMLANSLTGRGKLPAFLGSAQKEINAAFFSIKFLKSNWDKLTAHSFGTELSTGFARKEAAKNVFRTFASTIGLMTLADTLWPDSVEWDPRSSNAGKIKIGDTTFDITGGVGGIVTQIAKQLTNQQKSTTSGKITQLGKDYGAPDRFQVFVDFWSGKASPLGRALIDRAKGRTFSGAVPTLSTQAYEAFTPMMVSNIIEMNQDPNSANMIIATIADAIGISVNTMMPVSANWNNNPGAELTQFRDKVGKDKFNQANTEYNRLASEKIRGITRDDRYKKMNDNQKQQVLTKAKNAIKDTVFKKYGFEYKRKEASEKDNQAVNQLAK